MDFVQSKQSIPFCQTEVCSIEIVNISVFNTPIMKDYYWKSMNITGLNKKFLQLNRNVAAIASIPIPPMPVNSPPIRVTFHFLNPEAHSTSWSLKRIQLCKCQIVQMPVGVNNFRNVYACPHRELLTILPTSGEATRKDMFSFTLNIAYSCPGQTMLAYEFIFDIDYKIQLKFLFDVYEFNPRKCILTQSLLPMCIYKSEHALQPIWVHNPFSHDLDFKITTEDRNIVFILEFMEIKTNFRVKGSATNMFVPIPAQHSPKVDLECPESPFTLYKNHLAVTIGTRERTSRMVVLHNTSDICIQYLWKENSMKGYYSAEVVPPCGTCKPKHTVSCIIKITGGSTQIVFGNIPIVCEIYTFSGTRIDHVEECSLDSSIDEKREPDPLITRLFVNLSLRVKALCSLDIPTLPSLPSADLAALAKKKFKSGHFDRDIFDKLFWNFIYNEDFLNDIVRKKCDQTYEDAIRDTDMSESVICTSKLNKSGLHPRRICGPPPTNGSGRKATGRRAPGDRACGAVQTVSIVD
ncbi:unnamed protein product [Hermetia illucens]|uniref:Uncharacterized protein n=1 Tax=Hermetia illucens TaxID=343691 RepID=A0A7R8V388_HERIL|nr:unnamed protein product [Hermetia illucens]